MPAVVSAPCDSADGMSIAIRVNTDAVKDGLATTSEHFMLGAIAGFLGGVCQTYVGQPFDTVKVRMQTSARLGSGFVKTGFLTFRNEGFRGLYHGTTPALLFGLLENTIAFGVNEELKRYLLARRREEGRKDLPVEQLAFCGAAGGFVHCMFSCPTEVVKCKLQVAGTPYRGPLDCARSILKTQGIGGLYVGFVPFVLREIPFYLIFFSSYEILCNKLQQRTSSDGSGPRRREDLNGFEIVAAGGLAGMIGWSGVQPFDTAMVRMQTGLGAGGAAGTFPSTCAHIYQSQGWRGFFPGWIPAMLRAFPANAALFVGFEGSRRMLHRLT